MAVQTEDHPISYNALRRHDPARPVRRRQRDRLGPRQLGTGGRPARGHAKGKLLFRLHGQKLAGLWELVRIAKPDDRQDPWFLFKKHDQYARPMAEYDVIKALPDSVVAKPLPRSSSASRRPRRARKAARRSVPRPTWRRGRRRTAGEAEPQLATLPPACRRAATGSSRPSSTATG